MNETQVVTKLSELPAGELVSLQLIISLAYQACFATDPKARDMVRWGERLTQALEMKRADYWTLYDEVDENPIGI